MFAVDDRVRVKRDLMAAQWPTPNLTGRAGVVREVSPRNPQGLVRVRVDLDGDRNPRWFHNDELEAM